MASFDSVNYSLRPNKAVERKIVFSGLSRVSRRIDLSTYRYVGLGSLWFVDFLMAHRVLGVTSMLSIERTEMGHQRAKFNCPLACIDLVLGNSTEVIPTLNFGQSLSLVWFDYDSSIGGPVLSDIQAVAASCAPDTILIVTINAKRDELPTETADDAPLTLEESLRRVAGDLVPTPLSSRRFQASHYPNLLGEVVANQFRSSSINNGRGLTFVELFNLAYSDGTPMITVGGMFASAEKAAILGEVVHADNWQGVATEMIAVPPLTIKEKIALDRMLPSAAPPTDSQMAKVGFQLKRHQIDTYHRYYRHYPMFGELLW